ncbi:IS66 family transposase [Marinomonas sp.]|uniref:IS66 family transposase n=1 Tax=Marinomonas sp. TaxID=1904862 RepID=UPI003BACAF31
MKKVPFPSQTPISYEGLSHTQLVELLTQKDQLLDDHHQVIRHQEKLLDERKQRIELLEELLRLAKAQKFAASSEKSVYQIDLFDEAELEAAMDALIEQLPEGVLPETLRPRKRQRGFSDKLPRVRVELRLSEDEKVGATSTFFSKVKEELDIVPAKVRVLEYWQEKAVFKQEENEQERIRSAERPLHPLGKCAVSVSSLAYIIAGKYADGLPLYRLEKQIERYGAHLDRTNMANYLIRLNEPIKPLLNLLWEVQLEANYLQGDETRIQVLKEDGKTAQSDKWMWVIRGGPPDKPVIHFEYDPSRGGKVPVRLLDGFNGVLQADGYGGYNAVCRENNLTRIGCWDHARRKFVEASKAGKTKTKSKNAVPAKADVALGCISKLYAIETKIKGLSVEEKTTARQEQSRPILNAFKEWLNKNVGTVLKDGLTYKAIQYTLNQSDYLTGYCEDGQLHISNVLAENAIRPFAIGRKNWLFADTSQGAHASATWYSLVETAKANGLEPYAYILHILQHIASADTVEKLEALLPWQVKTAL